MWLTNNLVPICPVLLIMTARSCHFKGLDESADSGDDPSKFQLINDIMERTTLIVSDEGQEQLYTMYLTDEDQEQNYTITITDSDVDVDNKNLHADVNSHNAASKDSTESIGEHDTSDSDDVKEFEDSGEIGAIKKVELSINEEEFKKFENLGEIENSSYNSEDETEDYVGSAANESTVNSLNIKVTDLEKKLEQMEKKHEEMQRLISSMQEELAQKSEIKFEKVQDEINSSIKTAVSNLKIETNTEDSELRKEMNSLKSEISGQNISEVVYDLENAQNDVKVALEKLVNLESTVNQTHHRVDKELIRLNKTMETKYIILESKISDNTKIVGENISEVVSDLEDAKKDVNIALKIVSKNISQVVDHIDDGLDNIESNINKKLKVTDEGWKRKFRLEDAKVELFNKNQNSTDSGQGTVVINVNGKRGTICYDGYPGWNDASAQIICKMMGSSGAVSMKVEQRQFEIGDKSKLVDLQYTLVNVDCTGEEADISLCLFQWNEAVRCPGGLAAVSCTCDKSPMQQTVKTDGLVVFDISKNSPKQKYVMIPGGLDPRNGVDLFIVVDDPQDKEGSGFYSYNYGDANGVMDEDEQGKITFTAQHSIFGTQNRYETWSVNVTGKKTRSNKTLCFRDNCFGFRKNDAFLKIAAVSDMNNEKNVQITAVIPRTRQCHPHRPTAEIELYQRDKSTTVSGQGAVLLTVDNKKGFVCDDFWSDKEATVVCRMLKKPGGASAGSNKFGMTENGMRNVTGGGSFVMDDVDCTGDEEDIRDCSFTRRTKTNCHRGDTVDLAGVICV